MKAKIRLSFLLIAVLSLVFGSFSPARAVTATHFVGNTCLSAPCDGTSWDEAFPTLQDALAVAASGDKVWVQAGVYYPDEGAGQVNNSRSASFSLITGVAIFGGFNGTETQFSQRDEFTNITILSGDIDKNDTNTDGNKIAEDTTHILGSNSYHVVSNIGLNPVDNTAILDGFTITAGKADGNVLTSDTLGGGIRLMSGHSPTLRNLTVIGNFATANGGGMYASQSSNASLTNVNFTRNHSGNNGGGLYFDDSDPTYAGGTLLANTADDGGGMSVVSGSSPTLSNLVFIENSASTGGGMVVSNATPSLTNINFQENAATAGGGLFLGAASNIILQQASFRGNTATQSGAGIFFQGSIGNYVYLLGTNLTFSNNDATVNGGAIYSSYGDVSLINATFSDNDAASGGGLYKNNSTAAYLRNTIIANSTGGDCVNLNGSGGTALNSLFEDSVNTCGAVNGVDGNRTGTDPLLSAYQSFGITGTHPLLANSPAINTGTNTGCPSADQRGMARPQGGICDMGAFEVEFLSLTVQSVGANDGHVLESNETSSMGGTANSTSTVFHLGDDAANKQYRGILHFNTSTLPNNAVIFKATLKIKTQSLVGTDPFTILGPLTVDIRKPSFSTPGLTVGDFQAAAGSSVVSRFGTSAVSGWYSAILNNLGKANINLTGTTEFRLYFSTDDNNNRVADYMKFYSGNTTYVNSRPQLIVEYYIP